MTGQAGDVTVQVKYKDVEKTFSGNMEEVWLCINKLFLEFLPSFKIASKLTLNVDLQNIAKECEGIIAFSEEGPNLLVPRSKLTDNETLILWLTAYHIGYQLGVLKNDSMPKDELQAKLCKDAKIASTRIGELVKNEMATKVADERIRITTFGIIQTQKEVLPKIKARIEPR
ncbi:hypothetical protein MUP01_05335 [Candidatus Bathyarchaeota archaeon]|nr:hypothetical protein [Candidatus Bathyarchaeota archaeon]